MISSIYKDSLIWLTKYSWLYHPCILWQIYKRSNDRKLPPNLTILSLLLHSAIFISKSNAICITLSIFFETLPLSTFIQLKKIRFYQLAKTRVGFFNTLKKLKFTQINFLNSVYLHCFLSVKNIYFGVKSILFWRLKGEKGKGGQFLILDFEYLFSNSIFKGLRNSIWVFFIPNKLEFSSIKLNFTLNKKYFE